jgi:hypothetical protein
MGLQVLPQSHQDCFGQQMREGDHNGEEDEEG